MSGVFRTIDPPPPHRPASVYPRLWCGGRTHLLGGEGSGGPNFWKTPDTALYSIYVSNLWLEYFNHGPMNYKDSEPKMSAFL